MDWGCSESSRVDMFIPSSFPSLTVLSADSFGSSPSRPYALFWDKGFPLGSSLWSLVYPYDSGTFRLWRSLSLSNATNSPTCGLLAHPSTPRRRSSTSPLWGLGNRQPPA